MEREPLLPLLESNRGQTAAAANLKVVTLVGGGGGGGVVGGASGIFAPLQIHPDMSLEHRHIPVGAEEGK